MTLQSSYEKETEKEREKEKEKEKEREREREKRQEKEEKRRERDEKKHEKEEKKAKPERNKPFEKVESPKVSRLTRKSNKKEEVSEDEFESFQDFLPHRFTRSQSRKENIEMFTEPLIYNSRKVQRSSTKEIKEASPLKIKGNNRSKVERKRLIKQANKIDRRSESVTRSESKSPQKPPKKENQKSKSRSKLRIELEEEGVRIDTNSNPSESEKSHKRKQNNTEKVDKPILDDNDSELAKMLEDVDENEDCESFELNIETFSEPEAMAKSQTLVNGNKRSVLLLDEDIPAPTCKGNVI